MRFEDRLGGPAEAAGPPFPLPPFRAGSAHFADRRHAKHRHSVAPARVGHRTSARRPALRTARGGAAGRTGRASARGRIPAPEAEPVLEEPVLEEPVLDDPPARFCSVPFTSTRLPTSVEKFEALPVKRYVVPLALIVELLPVEPAPVALPVALPVAPPAVLPVGLPVEPVVPVADPVVDDEEPAPIDASVRM